MVLRKERPPSHGVLIGPGSTNSSQHQTLLSTHNAMNNGEQPVSKRQRIDGQLQPASGGGLVLQQQLGESSGVCTGQQQQQQHLYHPAVTSAASPSSTVDATRSRDELDHHAIVAQHHHLHHQQSIDYYLPPGGVGAHLSKNPNTLPPTPPPQTSSASRTPIPRRFNDSDAIPDPDPTAADDIWQPLNAGLLKQCLCSAAQHDMQRIFPQASGTLQLHALPLPQLRSYLSQLQLLFDIYLKQSRSGRVCRAIGQCLQHAKRSAVIAEIIGLADCGDRFVQYLATRTLCTFLMVAQESRRCDSWLKRLVDNLFVMEAQVQEVHRQQTRIGFSLEIFRRILEWNDVDFHPLDDENVEGGGGGGMGGGGGGDGTDDDEDEEEEEDEDGESRISGEEEDDDDDGGLAAAMTASSRGRGAGGGAGGRPMPPIEANYFNYYSPYEGNHQSVAASAAASAPGQPSTSNNNNSSRSGNGQRSSPAMSSSVSVTSSSASVSNSDAEPDRDDDDGEDEDEEDEDAYGDDDEDDDCPFNLIGCHLEAQVNRFNSTKLKYDTVRYIGNKWQLLLEKMSVLLSSLEAQNQQHHHQQHQQQQQHALHTRRQTENLIYTFLELWRAIIAGSAKNAFLTVNDTQPFYAELDRFEEIHLRRSLPPVIYKQLLQLFNAVLCYGDALATEMAISDDTCKLAQRIIAHLQDASVHGLLQSMPTTDVDNPVGLIGYAGRSTTETMVDAKMRRALRLAGLRPSDEQADAEGPDAMSSAGTSTLLMGVCDKDKTFLQNMVLLVLKSVAVRVRVMRSDSSDSSMDSVDDAQDYAEFRQLARQMSPLLEKLNEFSKNWLQMHPALHFSRMLVTLFIDQDDFLIEAMVCTLDVAAGFHFSAVAEAEEQSSRQLIWLLNPVYTFLEFVSQTNRNWELLLNYLISTETCFLLYFLRLLKYITVHWAQFVRSCEQWGELYGERNVLGRTMALMGELRKEILYLVAEEKFPYDIWPVLIKMEKCASMWEDTLPAD